VLLVSVPYVSPLRRLSVLWRDDRRFVCEPLAETQAGGRFFWQYAFGVREFSRLLRAAGFRVERTFPYAILFGLYDLPLLPRLLERRTGREQSASVASLPPLDTPKEASRPHTSLPKRLLVSEDRSVAGIGSLVELTGRLCANMMMFVCQR